MSFNEWRERQDSPILFYNTSVQTVAKPNHCELPIVIHEQTNPDGKIGGHVKTLSLDNLIAGGSYNGYGLPNFIQKEFLTFNKIRNTQYISDNDELVIRVTNIDVYSK